MENEPLYFIGRAVVTIFHNETNLFSIVKVKQRETNTDYKEKEIVMKGHFPKLSPEDDYRFTGTFVNHPTYGRQFNVTQFAKEMPSTKTGVIHYLSSDLFPGIGKKTAENVVDALGEDAIQKIVQDPSCLDGIPGLSKERKETLQTVLTEHLGLEKTIIQLNEWGFGPQLAMKIYNTYREETLEKIRENPYQLVLDVQGIGFQRADELGRRIGIEETSPARYQAAVVVIVERASLGEGHVYVTTEQVLTEAMQLLQPLSSVSIEYDALAEAVVELGKAGKLIVERDKLYLPSLHASEVGIATVIQRHLERPALEDFPASEIFQAIGEVEEEFDVSYAPSQVEAIQCALTSPMMILTGGPGTGKTTVIRGIVETFAKLHGYSLDPKHYAYESRDFPIVLAAPTGRAAKRMSESTGLPAMTIHRLLGFTSQDNEEEFDSDSIAGELIIIDEMSMVDNWLAYQLLKAIPKDAQLIFVGDQDQLPSVGPGQVLTDFIRSKTIPVIELQQVFRQSGDSSIIELAHQMKMSTPISSLTMKRSDRSFIRARGAQAADAVEQVIVNAVEKGFSIHDIQVLAPMYRGDVGIDALNKRIQEKLNPLNDKKREIVYGDTHYRVGDKVLQLVNQPESNVFNGDIGEVVAIFYAKETTEKKDVVVVAFDAIEVTYEKQDLNQLTLAYCCSIHKAQGSEFPLVIMPLVRSFRNMLQKNLIYTGITRAKQFLILVGEEDIWLEGMHKIGTMQRQTTLKERLTDEVYEDVGDTPLVLSEETIMSIDPMIGMENISPYDFM